MASHDSFTGAGYVILRLLNFESILNNLIPKLTGTITLYDRGYIPFNLDRQESNNVTVL